MNDASLTPEHGFPVRLVVPGFYGTNSVKWLTRLTLAEARALGPFTTRWYNDPVVQNGSESPTRLTAPVWSIAPQSLIVSPAPNATTGFSEEIEIWGWAWADGGVQAVDVAVDGGSWQSAKLETAIGQAWQRFAMSWAPGQRGTMTLASRATSMNGEQQPVSGRRNAIYSVPVTVL